MQDGINLQVENFVQFGEITELGEEEDRGGSFLRKKVECSFKKIQKFNIYLTSSQTFSVVS